MGEHLYRFTHMLRASKDDAMTIVATPIFFSLAHFWLGRPVEEFDDVFGPLGGGGGRAVFEFDQAVHRLKFSPDAMAAPGKGSSR